MASLTGFPETYPFDSNGTAASSEASINLRARARDANGREYILLAGVASNHIGSWVKYDENGSTILLTTNAVGPVGVSMVANQNPGVYSWFQIYGDCSIALRGNDAITADVALYTSATAGYIESTDVSTELVVGAFSTVAASGAAGTTGTVAVYLVYPSVYNAAID